MLGGGFFFFVYREERVIFLPLVGICVARYRCCIEYLSRSGGEKGGLRYVIVVLWTGVMMGGWGGK
jgi:hypothetical protein